MFVFDLSNVLFSLVYFSYWPVFVFFIVLCVFDLRELARTLTRSHAGMRTAPEIGATTVNTDAALSNVSNPNETKLN